MTIGDWNADDLRHLVRVQFQHASFHGLEHRGAGFNDQQRFGFFAQLFLPAVKRSHAADHVDTSRQTFFDQGSGNGFGDGDGYGCADGSGYCQ